MQDRARCYETDLNQQNQGPDCANSSSTTMPEPSPAPRIWSSTCGLCRVSTLKHVQMLAVSAREGQTPCNVSLAGKVRLAVKDSFDLPARLDVHCPRPRNSQILAKPKAKRSSRMAGVRIINKANLETVNRSLACLAMRSDT